VNLPFTGALNGKFSLGTDAKKLFVFVSDLGGWCVKRKHSQTQKSNVTHHCSIVLESGMLFAIDLQIDAIVEKGKVVVLQASQQYEIFDS